MKQDLEKDEKLLEKRLIELSRTAYQQDRITFSDFLNLNEQNILSILPKDRLYTKVVSFGGYEMAERRMAAFIPEALSLRSDKSAPEINEIDFPFTVLRISPLNARFSEPLRHRDYLGAVLNLGIDRNKTGDILTDGTDAYLFLHRDVSEYIAKKLTRIRHTSVRVTETETVCFHPEQKFEEIRGTVASLRLDSLLAVAFSFSRSRLTGVIESGKVFVNGRLMTSNGYQISEGDIISVRGMGKFKYIGSGDRTRKNRIPVLIYKYSG